MTCRSYHDAGHVAHERTRVTIITVLATGLLVVTVGLCGGTLLWHLHLTSQPPSRVQDIRRLRQEGVAVNQENEA